MSLLFIIYDYTVNKIKLVLLIKKAREYLPPLGKETQLPPLVQGLLEQLSAGASAQPGATSTMSSSTALPRRALVLRGSS